jgi:uncharacterized protein YdaU (DUF1376 family)
MKFFQFHIGDYVAATAHLTLIEDAIYSRLLRRYYLDEKPFADDREMIARVAGARTAEEVAAVDSVLKEFFYQADDGWRSKRADQEIAVFKEKSIKAKKSAMASVSARSLKASGESTRKEANAERNSSERSTNAQRTLSERSTNVELTINQEPITNNQEEIAIHTAAPPRGAVAASDLVEVVSAWNETAGHQVAGVSMQRVLDGPLSDNRKRSLKARLADKAWRANWQVALSRIKDSTFCHGQGNQGWIADFDWFIRKETVGKILEGKYDNRERSAAVGQRDNVGSPNRYRQGDFATKAAEAMRRAEEKGSSLWSDEESGQEPSA